LIAGMQTRLLFLKREHTPFSVSPSIVQSTRKARAYVWKVRDKGSRLSHENFHSISTWKRQCV